LPVSEAKMPPQPQDKELILKQCMSTVESPLWGMNDGHVVIWSTSAL
jgi:hypothetical protein